MWGRGFISFYLQGSESRGDEFSVACGTEGSKGSFKAYHRDIAIAQGSTRLQILKKLKKCTDTLGRVPITTPTCLHARGVFTPPFLLVWLTPPHALSPHMQPYPRENFKFAQFKNSIHIPDVVASGHDPILLPFPSSQATCLES